MVAILIFHHLYHSGRTFPSHSALQRFVSCWRCLNLTPDFLITNVFDLMLLMRDWPVGCLLFLFQSSQMLNPTFFWDPFWKSFALRTPLDQSQASLLPLSTSSSPMALLVRNLNTSVRFTVMGWYWCLKQEQSERKACLFFNWFSHSKT